MYDTDVLIVGAGPTGLALALELAALGVSFRIIDKDPVRSIYSRAVVVQPRTLELLDRHGAASDLLGRGNTIHGAAVFSNKKLVTKISLDDVKYGETQFGLPLFISQVDTENFLEDRLSAYNIQVERSLAARDIKQDTDGVVVTVQRARDEEEEIRCQYVVGCDGSHSSVRRAANLTFEGAPYPQNFMLADAQIEWKQMDKLRDHFLVFFGQGLMAVFPMRDNRARILLISPKTNSMANKEEEVDLGIFQDAFDRLAPGTVRLHDAIWVTRFRLHHRVVSGFRDGRLFVAGDAAHIHSPAGGQGMNTGIQDAINLGWKLSAMLRAGHGGDEAQKAKELLDSYNLERHPVAKNLLVTTDRFFMWISWCNPIWLVLRNNLAPWILPRVFRVPGRLARALTFLAQFQISYRGSIQIGTAPPTGTGKMVLAGDRPPDCQVTFHDERTGYMMELCHGVKFHLFLFSGLSPTASTDKSMSQAEIKAMQAGLVDEAAVHIIHVARKKDKIAGFDANGHIHTVYGLKEPSYVYIRPDGYISHMGGLDSLESLCDKASKVEVAN